MRPKKAPKIAYIVLEQYAGLPNFFVFVTLDFDVDELTNWFKMSRITPPAELNKIMQYIPFAEGTLPRREQDQGLNRRDHQTLDLLKVPANTLVPVGVQSS
jgi:hypothetical protein